MSSEQPDDGAPAEAEGGHKGGKLHGLLHGPHSTEILVLCSVVTVVLGYLTFRGKGGKGAASAAAQVSPTGVTAGDVAGFDQASVQGLTDQLSTMAQAQAGAFQDFSTTLQQTGQAQVDAQTGLQTAIQNQGQVLGQINTSISALPQQIASRIPAPINYPAPSAPSAPSGGGGGLYTVKAGDSLSRIAARFPSPKITWQTIYAANRSTIGANPAVIHPGQQLRIA